MTLALYATIWIALAGFVAADAAKHRRPVPDWAWPISLAGAILCAAHIVIAFGHHHHWNHDAAIAETARQTAAVYGLAWGGGVYVNYAFLAAWLVDLWWWRAHRSEYFARPAAVVWGMRAFFFTIIFNAAVVFASAPRRVAGLAVSIALLVIWVTDLNRRAVRSGPPIDARPPHE